MVAKIENIPFNFKIFPHRSPDIFFQGSFSASLLNKPGNKEKGVLPPG